MRPSFYSFQVTVSLQPVCFGNGFFFLVICMYTYVVVVDYDVHVALTITVSC